MCKSMRLMHKQETFGERHHLNNLSIFSLFIFKHNLKGNLFMPLIILWIGLALLLGIVASSSGRSFWAWFILGIIIDPILAGLLYLLIAKDA